MPTRIDIPEPTYSVFNYCAALAPCFIYSGRYNNAHLVAHKFNKVGQLQFLDQIYNELVFCAMYKLATSDIPKPKFADCTLWLIRQYSLIFESVYVNNETLDRSKLEWANNLYLTLENHGERLTTPPFLHCKLSRLKDMAGCLWHAYRFQLDTRAKRKLNAEAYRTFLEGWRQSTTIHEGLSWHVLEMRNIIAELYDEPVHSCRRNQNVLAVCNAMIGEVALMESQVPDSFGWSELPTLCRTFMEDNRRTVFNWVCSLINLKSVDSMMYQSSCVLNYTPATANEAVAF